MKTKNMQVICPECSTKNSIKNTPFVNLASSPRCKNCDEPLFAYFDKPLRDISPDAFIHDLDRQMLEALRKIPGVDNILRSLLRHSLELAMRLHHQGNFVKASPEQLPSLYRKLQFAADMLDITTLPELYVVQDARVNAYTFGVEKCSIAISSSLLDLMTDEEVTCVLAHELGHIKAHHVLYKTASKLLLNLADSIAQKTFGIGGLMLYPVQIALLRWDRASELSSDRAALLVVKNPMVVLSTMMKLAGGSIRVNKELTIKAFIEQASAYERTQEEGPLGKYIAVMNGMFNSHPFPIWRAKEIIDWVNSGDYFKILQGDFFTKKKLRNESEFARKPYTETLDKAVDSLRSWYDKNFKE